MPASTLTGTTGTGSGTYGSVPTVTSPTTTAGTAISGNIANLSDLYKLASGLNTYQNQQVLSNLYSNNPALQAEIAQSNQNITNNLAGIVSPEVINQLAKTNAERGSGLGFGVDSPNITAAFNRLLGQSSQERQDLGQSQLTASIARTPTASLVDLNKYLVGAGEQQAAQTAANVYASSPNPTLQAKAEEAAAKKGLTAGAGSVSAPATGGVSMPSFTSGTGGYAGTIGGGATNLANLSDPLGATQRWQDLAKTWSTTSDTASQWYDASGMSLADYPSASRGYYYAGDGQAPMTDEELDAMLYGDEYGDEYYDTSDYEDYGGGGYEWSAEFYGD